MAVPRPALRSTGSRHIRFPVTTTTGMTATRPNGSYTETSPNEEETKGSEQGPAPQCLLNPVCGFLGQGHGAAYHGRCVMPTRGGAPWPWTR